MEGKKGEGDVEEVRGEGKGREGKGRQGKGMAGKKGKGREAKGRRRREWKEIKREGI